MKALLLARISNLTKHMDLENQRDKIIEQLEILNAKMDRQNSVWRILRMGVIHGVGFFVGSAILATIALGVLGPMFGKIEWVKNNFQAGAEILR